MRRNKKKISGNLLLLIIVICFTVTSCGKRVYTSGTYGSIKSYTARPEYKGKNTKATYISTDYSSGDAGGVRDKKTLISVRAHRSITRKYFNLYYGLGGTIGNYKFGGPINENSNFNSEAFYSLNSKAGFNFNLPTKRMDWRLVGAELTYNYEFGPYQNVLKEVKDSNEDSNLLIFNNKSMLYYNFTSEAVFKFNEDNTLSLGIYFGDLLNKTKDLKNRGSGFSGTFISYRFKKFTCSVVNEGGQASIDTTKFGLTYQLF